MRRVSLCVDSGQSAGVAECNPPPPRPPPPMNELALTPEAASERSTFQPASGSNDRLCPPLFPGMLINPIVVSCPDRTDFCDWIQHFKAADVPVLSPPPPVYDIIYTPTHREVRQPECVRGGIKSSSTSTRSCSHMHLPHFALCDPESTVQQVERSPAGANGGPTIGGA